MAQIFPGSDEAVLQVTGGQLTELMLGGKRFPLAPNQAAVPALNLDGDFGPIEFILVNDGPAQLRVKATVAGVAGAKTLAVTVGGGAATAVAAGDIVVEPTRVRIPLGRVVVEFEPLPSHVRVALDSAAAAALEISSSAAGESVQLVAMAAAQAIAAVRFNLFWKTPEGSTLGIPLALSPATVEGRFAFGVDLKANAEVRLFIWRQGGAVVSKLPFFEEAANWVATVPDAVKSVAREVVGFAERALLAGAQVPSSTVQRILLLHPDARLVPGGLELSGLGADIVIRDEDQPDQQRVLQLRGGSFLLDRDWNLQSQGSPELKLILQKDELLLRGNASRPPLSIHFKRDTVFTLALDPRQPFLAMGGVETPALVYVPGLRGVTSTSPTDFSVAANGDIQPTREALHERFVLKFKADQPGSSLCRITPQGAQMTAEAVPTAIAIGEAGAEPLLRNVQLEHGHLTLDRGDYDLDIAASAQLGYFERASGKLSVRAASRAQAGEFAARFGVQIAGPWEDPTGSIEVRDPGATVELKLQPDKAAGGAWSVRGWVSGTVRFKAVERWIGGASEWLRELFDELSLRFDQLPLHDFLHNATKYIRLNLQSTGRQLKLWSVLRFELTEFSLGKGDVVLAGKVHFTLEGGFYFMGGIPRMRISLKDGIDLVEDAGQPLTLEGKLVTPTGITATLRLVREKSATRQRLAGQGSLQIPAWPAIMITCGFGKRLPEGRSDWIPLLFLFVEADIPITIFPCVVLRELGLGFGINQKLRGFNDLWKDEKAFDNLMKDPRGLPNPAEVGDWEDGGGKDFTDVALVARTHVAPSPEGRGPFPYVADALIYIQPTSEFTIAFTSNLWLFTGLDDAREPVFRSAPLVQTVIVLYPRHGYLEARSRTRRDSKMKAVPDAIAKSLSLVETEMLLKATPDMFRLRVGLMVAELRLARFDLRGTMLFGIELGNGQAIMLMQQTLAGGFDLNWGFGLQLGPLRLEVGLEIHARLGYSLLLAGGYFGSDLGVLFYGLARVHMSIELKVQLALSFYLRIKIGWFKITISWSLRMSASLSIGFDAEVEAMIGTSGLALRGEGTLNFSCCGFSFSPHISFEVGNANRLGQVRARLRPLLPANQSALP